jgi:hypothetical protein
VKVGLDGLDGLDGFDDCTGGVEVGFTGFTGVTGGTGDGLVTSCVSTVILVAADAWLADGNGPP